METTQFNRPRKNFRETATGQKPQRRRPLGKYRWAVYPDYWKESWGKKPLLGYVTADDEFYAEREAYNRGLLIVNYTFRPEVIKLGPVEQN